LKFTLANLFVFMTAAWIHAASADAATTRPMIWVTDTDRTPVLDKIKSQTWARDAFAAMQMRVADAIVQHQRDPDAFLRGLPLVIDPANPGAHPTLALIGGNMASQPDRDARGKLQRHLLIGVDCGVLYFLTRDAAYARCAADILHATVEALVRMKPNESTVNGGWIYPEDHLYEARALGAQLPLLYDFVHSHLKTGATIYDLGSRKPTAFDFAHAQQVFRTYARLAIEHGIIDANWPVLEMPSLTHNVLALDDAAERSRLLAHVTHLDTPNQDSLAKVVAEYAKPGSVWPESFQYSAGVSSLATYLVALLRRQDPPAPLPPGYAQIPLSLARLSEWKFPNGEYIRLGDGPRQAGTAYESYEIAYALGQREGDANLRATFGALINLGIEQGEYQRTRPLGHRSGASIYLSPLQLLWFAPEITGKMAPPAPRTTDVIPFAGAVLQRNFSNARNPEHSLMAVVSGGHYVHAHASGMALELYGAGQVLGANAGKGTYTTDEHENYRRLFAAYNTVIVNGASRSEGGWVNLGINTVETITLEPAAGRLPISPQHSFTLTGFNDDRGPGAKARQERLVGIVRTFDHSGYYVDVFRSKSELADQFHDYLYHNIGELVTFSPSRESLGFLDAPLRFQPVPGSTWSRNRSFLFPGWHVFKSVEATPPTDRDVSVLFTAGKLKPAAAHMRLFIPGAPKREYATALAPETKEAPEPYAKSPTPVLAVRQQGEAWNRPFAVVYEPFSGTSSGGSVRSVVALERQGVFSGLKVVSVPAGGPITDYILIPPSSGNVYEEPSLGLKFQGRYAVVTLDEAGRCSSIYVGDGSTLQVGDIEFNTLSGQATSASIRWFHGKVSFTARDSATLRQANGPALPSRAPAEAP